MLFSSLEVWASILEEHEKWKKRSLALKKVTFQYLRVSALGANRKCVGLEVSFHPPEDGEPPLTLTAGRDPFEASH